MSVLFYGQVQDGWCSDCNTGEPPAITATAPALPNCPPSQALDKDPKTAWCEGVRTTGAGMLTARFDHPVNLSAIWILGGYFKSEETLQANARIQTLRIGYKLPSGEIRQQTVMLADPAKKQPPLVDMYGESYPTFEEKRARPAIIIADDARKGGPLRETDLIESVSIQILSTYIDGAPSLPDTCISELRFDVYDPAWGPR